MKINESEKASSRQESNPGHMAHAASALPDKHQIHQHILSWVCDWGISVPPVQHMESCQSNEMAKHGRDDLALVKFSTSARESLYCNAVMSSAYPFTAQQAKWITQVLTHKSSPITVILSSFIHLLSN